jgi:hypothetical protein
MSEPDNTAFFKRTMTPEDVRITREIFRQFDESGALFSRAAFNLLPPDEAEELAAGAAIMFMYHCTLPSSAPVRAHLPAAFDSVLPPSEPWPLTLREFSAEEIRFCTSDERSRTLRDFLEQLYEFILE